MSEVPLCYWSQEDHQTTMQRTWFRFQGLGLEDHEIYGAHKEHFAKLPSEYGT